MKLIGVDSEARCKGMTFRPALHWWQLPVVISRGRSEPFEFVLLLKLSLRFGKCFRETLSRPSAMVYKSFLESSKRIRAALNQIHRVGRTGSLNNLSLWTVQAKSEDVWDRVLFQPPIGGTTLSKKQLNVFWQQLGIIRQREIRFWKRWNRVSICFYFMSYKWEWHSSWERKLSSLYHPTVPIPIMF
jgi:hypothetical protein